MPGEQISYFITHFLGGQTTGKKENMHPNRELADLPLNTILQIKSMLIAKAIADTPKKKPEGEYRSDAL